MFDIVAYFDSIFCHMRTGRGAGAGAGAGAGGGGQEGQLIPKIRADATFIRAKDNTFV